MVMCFQNNKKIYECLPGFEDTCLNRICRYLYLRNKKITLIIQNLNVSIFEINFKNNFQSYFLFYKCFYNACTSLMYEIYT